MEDLTDLFVTGRKPSGAKRTRRVRTPTILQMEAVECGAACLAMILAHLGRWVPLERMRIDCGVSRDGSKASYLVGAARKYGLTAKGLKAEPEDLKRLPLPLIGFWELDHFVVIEGYDRKRWYLNDPAMGPRTVDYEEFDKSFSGVCLTFEKGPGFVPGGRRPSIIRALRARSHGMGPAVFYAILAGLCLGVIGLVIPTFLKVYVDHYLVDRDPHWLKPLLWIMLLTVIVQTAVTWLQQNMILRLNTKLVLSISTRFFRHMMRLPTEFFAQRYGGELQSRLALNSHVARILSGQLPATVIHCMTAVFFVAVMLNYSVLLTAIGVIGTAVNLGVLALVSRKFKDLSKRLLQQQGKLTGIATAGLGSMETIKSTGGELDFFRRWAGFQAQSGNSSQDLGVWSALTNRVPVILFSLNSTAIMAVGGLYVMRGFLTLGDFIAFQALMAAFVAPISNLVGMGNELQQLEAALCRLDDVLDHEEDAELAKAEAIPLPPDTAAKLSGSIELRDVSFAYGTFDTTFIDKFNLTLNPGSRV
ncbi:ABC transporter transmembrane domain-containing protein, partial [Thermodesulfobacteriota bacterium]